MKVTYDKTYYEELVDIFEDAHKAGRRIKQIDMTIDEYKEVMNRFTNQHFLASIKSKCYLKSIDTALEPDTPMKAIVTYQVIDNVTDRCAKLYHAVLYIR